MNQVFVISKVFAITFVQSNLRPQVSLNNCIACNFKCFLVIEPRCEPCEQRGKPTIAVHFCHDCDERYCELCMKKHTISKNTKDHRIGNIPQVISEQIVPCAICCELGEPSQATCYCLDCKNPEPLCSSCAEEHTMMKRTKNHHISREISSFTKRSVQISVYLLSSLLISYVLVRRFGFQWT